MQAIAGSHSSWRTKCAPDASISPYRFSAGAPAGGALWFFLPCADPLSSGPKSAADLATAAQTPPAAIYRLMRAVASIGLFQENCDARFVLTLLDRPMCAGRLDHFRFWPDSDLQQGPLLRCYWGDCVA